MSASGEWRINHCEITTGVRQYGNGWIYTSCNSCKNPTRPKNLAAFSLGKDDTFIGHLPGLTPATSTGWANFFMEQRTRCTTP